jgi:hypothetical protein
MVRGIDDLFPSVAASGYRITSPKDNTYNCLAWAAGGCTQWWWPTVGGREFWPVGIPRVETLEAVKQAFMAFGYEVCTGEEREPGFERIALFADTEGFPLHASRQLPNGRWTSKLGELEDVEHALRDLEGQEYGSVVLVMRRALPGAEKEESPRVVG